MVTRLDAEHVDPAGLEVAAGAEALFGGARGGVGGDAADPGVDDAVELEHMHLVLGPGVRPQGGVGEAEIFDADLA
jgi:hypothetical protein